MFLAGQLLRRIPAGAELPASPQPSSGLTKPSGAGRGISLTPARAPSAPARRVSGWGNEAALLAGSEAPGLSGSEVQTSGCFAELGPGRPMCWLPPLGACASHFSFSLGLLPLPVWDA